MKKANDNFRLASSRNLYKGRIISSLNNLNNISNNSGLTLTPFEMDKLLHAIVNLEEILGKWESSYNEFRKLHKMKTYENIS